jgi:hypothetical protein
MRCDGRGNDATFSLGRGREGEKERRKDAAATDHLNGVRQREKEGGGSGTVAARRERGDAGREAGWYRPGRDGAGRAANGGRARCAVGRRAGQGSPVGVGPGCSKRERGRSGAGRWPSRKWAQQPEGGNGCPAGPRLKFE